MKKALLICITLVLFVLLFLPRGLGEENGNIIAPETLEDRLDHTPLYIYLVDLRDRSRYDAAHIPYACSIPLDSLYDTMIEIIFTRFTYMGTEVIVYGDTAEEESQGVQILEELGFSNVWRLNTLQSWPGRLMSSQDDMRVLGFLDTVDIYGKSVDASLIEGHRLTLVNVWATYTSSCIPEMKALDQLTREYADQGFQVVGLLSDTEDLSLSHVEEKVALAQAIVEKAEAGFPQLLPSHDLYWRVIGQMRAVPTSFFVDETGAMVGSVYVGARSYEEWKTIIEDTFKMLERGRSR